jgi:hypothetical protein
MLRWLAVAVLLGSLLALPTPRSAAAQSEDAAATVDLAAMMLRPADIGDEWGFAGSGIYDLESTAAGYASIVGRPADEVTDELEELNFQREYTATFELLDDEVPGGRAESLLVVIDEYDSTRNARGGFSLATEYDDSDFVEVIDGAEGIGDDALASRWAQSPLVDGERVDLTRLVIDLRVDRLTASLLLYDFAGDNPRLSRLESYAEALVERIQTVLDDGSPELFGQIPRWEGAVSGIDGYFRFGGEDIPLVFESERDREQRWESYGRATNIYALNQWIEHDGAAVGIQYRYRLIEFSRSRDATAYVNGYVDYLESFDYNQDLKSPESPPEFGDQSVAAAFSVELTDGTIWNIAEVAIRVGARVAIVAIHELVPESVELTGPLSTFAEAAVACLEAPDEPCATISVSADAFSEEADPGSNGNDDDDAGSGDDGDTDRPAPNPDAQIGSGDDDGESDTDTDAKTDGVYESELYGYSLTFDPDEWELDASVEDAGDDYDEVRFLNRIGQINVIGDPDYSRIQMDDCVANFRGFLGNDSAVSDVEPIRGEEGDESGLAWAAFTYLWESPEGEVLDSAHYIECRYVGDGLTIVILQTSLEELYDDMTSAREELLQGLELP